MGLLVDVCVIKNIAPYQTYIGGVCGENSWIQASQQNGAGQVIRYDCDHDKVGSFKIRLLQGVGVSVRCGGRLHGEEHQKSSPCVHTRVGCHMVT